MIHVKGLPCCPAQSGLPPDGASRDRGASRGGPATLSPAMTGLKGEGDTSWFLSHLEMPPTEEAVCSSFF